MIRTLLFLAALFLAAPSVEAQSPITAHEHIDDVVAAAQDEDPAAQLLAVSADSLSLDTGAASSWTYLFGGSEASAIAALQRGTSTITTEANFKDNARSFVLRGFTPIPIPPGWKNDASGWLGIDRIVERAETVGGEDFRANHDSVTISARLASLPAELVGLGSGEETLTAWLITYTARSSDASEFQVYTVMAKGGNALALFSEPRSLAFLKPQISDFAARRVAEDSLQVNSVNLTAVASVVPDLDGKGASILWRYTFYAPEKEAYRDVYVLYGSVVFVSMPRREPPSKQSLPLGWIDSDEAIAGAKDTLFREAPGVLAQAYLTRGLFPNDTERAAWQIDVVRASDDTSGTVYLDPRTGAFLDPPTHTKRGTPPGATRFAVSGPRPNPFRQSATLRFTLPAASSLTVSLFDVTGRCVRRRSLGRRPAGAQQVRVSGDDLPAGVYVYRVTAQSGRRTRVATGTMARVR